MRQFWRRSGSALLVVFLLVAWPRLVARAERLPLKAYTTADGLSNNTINRIVRDSRGFLWFCTDEGLSRFDGYTFTNFGTNEGLPHPAVMDLLETRAGDLWVATSGGLVRFNPKGEPARRVVYDNKPSPDTPPNPMFTVFTPAGDDRNARAFTRLLEARDGTIWGGTGLGLWRLAQTGGRIELQPVEIGLPGESAAQRYVNTLLEDRHGTLWIATNSGLYRRWPDGSAAHYGVKEGLHDRILDVLEDRNGTLWVGTGWGGLFQLAIGAGHAPPAVTRAYKQKDGFVTDWIFDLFQSSDGRIWAGTNVGLVEFGTEEKRQERPAHVYTRQSGFSHREIMNLAEDRDGNLWLGTLIGAMKLARSGFITLDVSDGIESCGSLFESSGGELYAAATVLGDDNAGRFSLGRFDGQRFTWLTSALAGNAWTDKPFLRQARSGEWWFGTDNGLYLLPRVGVFAAVKTARPMAVYSTRDGLASPIVYSIYEDARGDLWISSFRPANHGLARWERASRTIRDMTVTPGLPSLKDKLAASFAEDRAGNVWIGFVQGDLARYADGRFTVFTSDLGPARGRINDLHLDDAGRLWVATSRGGVSRIDAPEGARPAFVHYSTAEGLSSDSTTALTEDLDGRIYVGTGRGVDQITPTGRIKHFTTADGLAAGDILTALRDRNGVLWFGTRQGLSRFRPERDHPSAAPPVLIGNLRVAGARRNVSAIGEADLTLTDLEAGDHQLEIGFVGLSFGPGEVLRYQYRLEGADADWSAPTSQRTIAYANLAPGHYRFLVRAVTSTGAVSDTPARITFRVLPPVYARWWFMTLVVFTLGLIGIALYRYRVGRLLEVANMRTRIATDLHDDIGANLTRISILSEVARQRFGAAGEPEKNPLSSIADIARESVASMSDIVWAIDPERDSLLDLTRKMRQHADEVFTLREIELRFDAPGPEQNLKLGVNVRRDVLLIFKEAVNNAARHSRCSRVDIELRVDNTQLTLTVRDDGAGFDVADTGDGHGLVSMRRRALKFGGSVEVETGRNQGTMVRATIPASGPYLNR